MQAILGPIRVSSDNKFKTRINYKICYTMHEKNCGMQKHHVLTNCTEIPEGEEEEEWVAIKNRKQKNFERKHREH